MDGLITYVLLLTLFCGLGLSTNITRDNCFEPDCSVFAPGQYYPDYYNCNKYYVGVDTGTCVSLTCQDGFRFDPITSACVSENGSPCQSECATLPSTNNCRVYCQTNTEFVADPYDCSKYYICLSGGSRVSQSCPADHPYFDGKECQWDSTLCCESSCDPMCYGEHTVVPDLSDCTKFYYCPTVGVPSENNHLSCDSGNFFDSWTLDCIPDNGETCESPCSGGGTGPGNCQTSMNCEEYGNFARCTNCEESYFHCGTGSIGSPAAIDNCADGTVFNPNPSYPMCILKENCPFNG